MKIISGKYKGRKIEGFTIHGTRPTMDRVKESLFGMIGAHLKGSIVLDLFGGTGSLGLEALSEGASSCYFVDKNNIAVETMRKTIQNIDITEETHILCMDYKKAIEKFQRENIQFDVIFLDPPYHLSLIKEILPLIIQNKLIQKNGIIVCEYETEIFQCNDLIIYKEKKYGSKWIRVYSNKNL